MNTLGQIRMPLSIVCKGGQLERFEGLSPERQGQNLALTVLCVPCSLDGGLFGLSNFWHTKLLTNLVSSGSNFSVHGCLQVRVGQGEERAVHRNLQ